MDTQLYASLSEVGFRRSGDHLYRPHCQHCTACIAARIPVADFSPNRQQRRILKRNAELQVIRKRPSFNEEYYDLYRRYIEQRHADGDMYPPSRDQFATFLVRDLPFCCFFEFRLHGRLLAIAVTDVLPKANRMINETIRKKLGLPVEKVPSTLRDFGNTSGASLPVTMTARINRELEAGRNRVLLCGFGIGLSWGTCLVDIEGAKFPDLIES